MGDLNKRSEYGNNHLTRLEANVSKWEEEKRMEKEISEQANWKSDMKIFIEIIKSVRLRVRCNDVNFTPNGRSGKDLRQS